MEPNTDSAPCAHNPNKTFRQQIITSINMPFFVDPIHFDTLIWSHEDLVDAHADTPHVIYDTFLYHRSLSV
jgi:hypothetical protein